MAIRASCTVPYALKWGFTANFVAFCVLCVAFRVSYVSTVCFVPRPLCIDCAGVLTEHAPPTVFVIISMLSTLVVLSAWRAGYVKIRGVETVTERKGGPLDGLQMVMTLLRRW